MLAKGQCRLTNRATHARFAPSVRFVATWHQQGRPGRILRHLTCEHPSRPMYPASLPDQSLSLQKGHRRPACRTVSLTEEGRSEPQLQQLPASAKTQAYLPVLGDKSRHGGSASWRALPEAGPRENRRKVTVLLLGERVGNCAWCITYPVGME